MVFDWGSSTPLPRLSGDKFTVNDAGKTYEKSVEATDPKSFSLSLGARSIIRLTLSGAFLLVQPGNRDEKDIRREGEKEKRDRKGDCLTEGSPLGQGGNMTE